MLRLRSGACFLGLESRKIELENGFPIKPGRGLFSDELRSRSGRVQGSFLHSEIKCSDNIRTRTMGLVRRYKGLSRRGHVYR
jgi:hypothetical protein